MKINWAAVLVAAVVDFLLGAVWLSVFKAQWAAGVSEVAAANSAHPNLWPSVISFLCSLLLAYAIARFVASGLGHSLLRGLSVGILVGIAAGAAVLTEMTFEMKPGTFMAISGGYPVVGCILMGLVIGIWKPRATAAPPTKIK